MVSRWKVTTVSMFAAILLSSSSLLPLGTVYSQSATSACPTVCLSLISQSSHSVNGYSYNFVVTYYNSFRSSVLAMVYLVMRNQIGQTVGIDWTNTEIPSGGNETLHPSISVLLPPGNYSTSIFAVNSGGVAISNITVGSIEYGTVLKVSSFSESPDTDNVSVILWNLSPSPLVANITIIASENQRPLARNQTEITIPALSTVAVPLALIGTANPTSCLDFYIFMQNANGINWAPPDHESSCS